MQLYHFFNSSTSYRVRIALALKDLPFEYRPVNLRAGEQRAPHYVEDVNPSASVPVLVDGAFSLAQSLAIIDYLDQRHPEPRLIPADPAARARVLELANLIACDIHPVNNLRVLRYLEHTLHVSPEQKDAWYRHWIAEGMAAVEQCLERHGGRRAWCFGDAPTLADCCLVPQIANALRMGCELDGFTRCMAIYRRALEHPAFARAAPARQPDYIG
ncbi:maleylacetoacetate isomerase [Burkholderia alba]|uniref:maleylacetoacetate isomerase n=1 Tax=Burkholderia alba TaxID=2683677 RepID=UPI002B058A58|nr:maleylacetoacetate isomerase [Burkholderia alba]